jgi:hypothetical protein
MTISRCEWRHSLIPHHNAKNSTKPMTTAPYNTRDYGALVVGQSMTVADARPMDYV